MITMGRDDFFSFIGRGTRFVLFLTEEALSSGLVVPGCARCAMEHPDFGRSVNPISTRGWAYYAYHITTPLPGFSYLPTALQFCLLASRQE